MTQPLQLRIESHAGELLANQFWAADEPNSWLAVILPGKGYTMDMPLLFFTRRLLLWRGADVLNLNPATHSESFLNASDQEQLAWLKADVVEGMKTGLKQKNYRGIILAGKSIGSLAIAQAVSQAEALMPTAIIWLTPLLRYSVVVDAALKANGPQAHLCGGADSTFNPVILNQILTKKPLARAFVAPGANHILEVPGDDRMTFNGISDAMIFLGKFLDDTFDGSIAAD